MIRSVLVAVVSLIASCSAQPASANETHLPVDKLIIPCQVETTNSIHRYVVQILTRALELTAPKYGSVELVPQTESTVQTRQLRNLEKGWSDIVWMISTIKRDQRARPVKIPIIGGLYGYRILLVGQQSDYASSLSVSDLVSLSYTQGGDWPDVDILRANDYTVHTSPYLAGFKLVREGFIDAYPRAAHEAVLEVNSAVGENLVIAPDVLLTYYNPLFFYVDKNNEALANRLREGLSLLIRRGELQQILKAQPFYASAMHIMQERKVVELINPYLSQLAREAMEQYLETSEVLSYSRDMQKNDKCVGLPCG